MKQIVYFIPFSSEGLQNKFFASYFNPKSNVIPLNHLKSYLENNGLEINTIDFWGEKNRRDNDVLIAFDHPPVGFYGFLYQLKDFFSKKKTFPISHCELLKIAPKFSKKILIQWESPVNKPWVYRNIKSITALYDESYFIPRVESFPRFYYPQNFDRISEEYFNKIDRKFLVMMNSKSAAKGFQSKELYSERVKALKFFSQYDEVDLYGGRWEGDKSVEKIWKGFADDKPATMGSYTFALCFENAVWPGYVTEKIFDCMMVGTIPIYWGAPDIEEDVPSDCFIDMRKFKNYDDLRKFLHMLAPIEIEKYKQAIRNYFSSEKFKKFTPENFYETILGICI